MPRPRGDGIKVVRRQLADGTFREHRYLRKRSAAAPAKPETLDEAIADYLATPDFAGLKPRTRELYRSYLEQIRRAMGWMPLARIRPSAIKRVRIDLQATPSKANMWIALLSIVLQHAVEMDYLPTNPCAGVGRLPPAKREEIWSRAEQDRIFEALRPSLRLAFLLMLYTLQRPSDVLAMTVQRVVREHGRLFIQLRQQKTDTLLAVPVHSALEPLVTERLDRQVIHKRAGKETVCLLLVPSPTGLPWSRRNFSRAWDSDLDDANKELRQSLLDAGVGEEAVAAEIAARHRQRRDLRRTGIVRLAEAGATTPQIAAISGHSIDYCQRIIDTYLPRRTEVAIGGIEAWERAGTAGRVVSLKGIAGGRK